VKITVIATGFKEEERPRLRKETAGFTVNTSADDFDSISEPPSMVMQSHEEPVASASSSGSSFGGTQTVEASSASPDVIALDGMRDAMIRNFEQADLDVPAFLRKRGETM
jgi:hypothetical protein